MTPRLERAPALRIAGLRRTHLAGNHPETTRRQWFELVGISPVAGQSSQIGYGVYCDAGGHPGLPRFDYLTGVIVPADQPLPPSIDAIDLLASTYAVFGYDGNVREMRALWPRILGEWIAPDRLAPGPRFERFSAEFEPVLASGPAEIWVPVAE